MSIGTITWSLGGVTILIGVIIAAYLYMTRKFNYWKKRGVQETPPTPFLGNFGDCLFLRKSPGHFIKDLYEQAGAKGEPYIGFYILDKPSLVVYDRELVKRVLIKDFNSFADRYGSPDTRDRLGYANLFFLRNPAWKMLRSKLTPIFTSGKLKKMFELMLECADNLDTHLNSLEVEHKEKMVDVKEIIAKFTTDIIASTAFGLNVNSLNNPEAEFRKHGKKIFDFNIKRGFEFLSTLFIPDIARLTRMKLFGKEPTEFLRRVFWDTINQRIKSGEKRNDLIDILIDLRNTYGSQDIDGFKFDGDDIVAQAAIFFTGGFETSSTTTAFTLYEVAVHPEIQDRLREEILQALDKSNGQIPYDMIMSLPYLDMVISESLRVYPTLPFLDRMVTETYKVPNHDLVLEKNTPVYLSMLGMHFDPQYFPNPNKYDPERFNEENKRNRPSCVYFPFGEGPRGCIGARLGLLQSKLAVIKILSQYKLTTCEKTLIPMVFDPKGATTTPLNGGVFLNIRKLAK